MKPPAGYTISTQQNRFDLAMIHRFLRACYWARDIPRRVVARSIRNSLCFGVFYRGKQVGLARVITDRATFAYLSDVFILPAYRGRGMGKLLIGRILAHRDLQGLRRIMLSTRDAHGLYTAFGFKPLEHPDHYLSVGFPGVYGKKRCLRRRGKG